MTQPLDDRTATAHAGQTMVAKADDSLSPDQIRSIADRYEIQKEIARGSMGVVYRARHKSLNRDVAIKVLRPGQSDARFVREARLLAGIRSPHVVTVHDLHTLSDGRMLLAMEWVDSDLKRQAEEHGGRVDEAQALVWMRHTCLGMIAAEQANVVHRDVKPSNILINGRGEAVVADFGLARGPEGLTTAANAESSMTMGTPLYMAPEQAEDPRAVDTRSDIYGFGATFYHALTGRPPFHGATAFAVLYKHKMEPLIAPQSIRSDLSDRTSQILEKCLAKSPRERFQSFHEVLDHCESESSLTSESIDENIRPYVAKFNERRDIYLQSPRQLQVPDEYTLANDRKILVLAGDIAQQDADALVSSDDQYLSMSGGVSWSLLKAAGVRIRREIERMVPVRPGRAIVTSAGNLPARFIFHGVTMSIQPSEDIRPSPNLIQDILASCFYHADTLLVERIAFPLLGTGAGGFSREKCMDVMFRYLCKQLLRGMTPVREARIVIYPQTGRRRR